MEKNSLPESWEFAKIDDIAELIGGGTPSRGKNEYFGGKIVWLTPTEIPREQLSIVNSSKEMITEEGFRKSSARIIPKNSVLLTSRATIGNVAIAGCEVTTNQGFASFVCSKALNNRFLAYWLLGNKLLLEKEAKGTTFKEISKSKLKEFFIPVSPLNEQKRIVSKIEELLSLIENNSNTLNNTKNQLKQYEKSLIFSGFNGTITQDFRKTQNNLTPSKVLLESIKSKHKPKIQYKLNFERLFALPKDWSWVTISEIANVVSGNTPKGIDNYRKDDKIPFFKIADMNHPKNSLFMIFSEINLNHKEASDLKLKIHEKGTIVFPKRGGAISTNKKRIISKLSCFDLNIMGIKPIDIPSKFVYYWLLNIDLAKLSDGSNVPQINHDDVNPLPIPLPTKEEIFKMIKIFDSSFSIIKQSFDYLEKLIKTNQSLKYSVLRQAFSGKLVLQDPNDEPAAELLARIKAKKEKQSKKK